jgi:hypothetical protein
LGPEFKITTLAWFRIILGTTLVGSQIILDTTLVGSRIFISTTLVKSRICIGTTLHHARKNILPNIPQSYDEVHKVLDKLNIKANKQEKNLLVIYNQYDIIIFCTVENLNFL